MIKYKERITKVIDYIICDSCKKNCKSSIAEDSEYATLRANWGYWSDSDGRNYELHLCEHCFYDVLGHIKAGAPKDIAICDKLKNFPSVNIVSIEESEDRRNILYEELEECKISNVRTHIYKRYNDEDHKIIESDAINHIGKGPVTSHLKTIREWYESTDEEYTIIFEDDVCFDTVKYWNFYMGGIFQTTTTRLESDSIMLT
jgi:hypothetical protein